MTQCNYRDGARRSCDTAGPLREPEMVAVRFFAPEVKVQNAKDITSPAHLIGGSYLISTSVIFLHRQTLL